MKNVAAAITCLAVGLAIGFFARGVVDRRSAPTPQAATSATAAAWQTADAQHTMPVPPPGQKEVKLPAPGETYSVIGVVPGIANFVVKYDDNFYRGGELTAEEGAQALVDWGVRTVISIVPSDLERELCRKYNINLVELPFEKAALSKDTMNAFLDTVRSGEGPFYVHCHGGTHRGGALCLLYRLAVLDWQPAQAVAEYAALGGDPDNTDSVVVKPILEHTGK